MEFKSKETKREQRLRQMGARIATGKIVTIGSAEGVRSFTGREKPSAANLPPEYGQDLINAIRNEPYTKSLMEVRTSGETIRIHVRSMVEELMDEMQIPRDEQPYLPAQADTVVAEAERG